MKSYAVVAVLCVLAAAFVAADDMEKQKIVGSSYGGGSAPASYGGGSASASYGGGSASASYGGSSSGGSSGGATIPAPPCPKNYIISCQPHLAAAPCAPSSAGGYGGSSAGGYGGSAGASAAGAYSQNYPVYAIPAPLPYYGLV